MRIIIRRCPVIVWFCLTCFLVSCTANRYAREHPNDPMSIRERTVVVHVSDVSINLINVTTYSDSLTGEIPIFRTVFDKTDAMHLYLADDFKIAPDARRLVIPNESIIDSKVTSYGKAGYGDGSVALVVALVVGIPLVGLIILLSVEDLDYQVHF